MTQTSTAPAPVLPPLWLDEALTVALAEAVLIPTTEPVALISGAMSGVYGANIKIDHERFATDRRGPAWEKRWSSYVRPENAAAVLLRMVTEGREVYSVRAVRSALGGETTC